mmetsp:Transcript_71183/g.170475  ORF Transcript_71183/g.170475 Transcript_71183/m.170475 type:complete len:860 (-) Transcript_71183:91-2670(-)
MAYQVGCLPIGFGTCVPATPGANGGTSISPKDDSRRSSSTQGSLFLKKSLGKVPGLLDEFAAPCDVLPVSSSLRRVVGNLKASQASSSGKDEKPKHALRVPCLIALFVALDASKGLAVAWATVADAHTHAPAIVCIKNLLSISFGLALAVLLDGRRGFCMCLNIRRCVQAFPVAVLFCLAQVSMMRAMRTFDAGSLKVMAQVNLPTTVVLSRCFLGHQYSAQQWSAIALLLGATTAFMQVRLAFFRPPHWSEEDLSPQDTARGAIYVILGILLSCCASILAEAFLKTPQKVPFYIQKTNLMWGELLTAVVMTHVFPPFEEPVSLPRLLYEQVSDFPRLMVLLIWFIHGWMAGLLVKHCSVLVKNISHIFSALVMYFLPMLLVQDAVHFWPVSVVAILVLTAILTFAVTPGLNDSRHSKGSSDRDRRLGQVPELSSTPNLQEFCQDALQQAIPQEPRQGLGIRRTASLPSHVSDMLTWRNIQQQLPSPSQLCVLVISFVFLDALKPLLVSWAHSGKDPSRRFINGTFVLVQTSLSFLVGLGVATRPRLSRTKPYIQLHYDWRQRLHRCIHLPAVCRQLPVSICLVMSKWCLVMALERLDAGTVRVLCQSSLPVVGLGTSIFFNKRYSVQQWASLLALTVALVAFSYVQSELSLLRSFGDADGGTEALRYRPDLTGVLFIFCSISSNCLGALLVEKFLKQQSGKLYEQKAQLVLGEVIVNTFLVFGLPLVMSNEEMRYQNSPWARGFFVGWDSKVLCCVLIWIPAGWTATMLVKECSNLVKTVSQGAASVLTYVFSVMLARPRTKEWSSPVMFLALAVMCAALVFGMDPGSGQLKAAKKEPKDSWAVDSSYSRIGNRGMGA